MIDPTGYSSCNEESLGRCKSVLPWSPQIAKNELVGTRSKSTRPIVVMNSVSSFPNLPAAGVDSFRRLGIQPASFLVALLVSSILAMHSHAAVIFSQTGTNEGQYTETTTEFWAQGFTVGASDMVLNTVDVLLTAGDPQNAFFVDLYSNVGGSPGTLLETLSGNSNPGASGTYTFSSTGSALSANTSYWIVQGLGAGGDFQYWNEENSTSPEVGTSIGAKFSLDAGSNWSLQSGHTMQMVVNGTIAAPEPSRALLIFFGIAGFFMKRRRSSHAPPTKPSRSRCVGLDAWCAGE